MIRRAVGQDRDIPLGARQRVGGVTVHGEVVDREGNVQLDDPEDCLVGPKDLVAGASGQLVRQEHPVRSIQTRRSLGVRGVEGVLVGGEQFPNLVGIAGHHLASSFLCRWVVPAR